MATPKPGEIRCPTCHRSTPPATFCTQCGSAIPPDARIRPRGLDRDELQERIRARRSGGDPYRRGGALSDEPGGYERFEPEPEDRAALQAGSDDAPRRDHLPESLAPSPTRRGAPDAAAVAGGAAAVRPDLTREHDDWVAPAADDAGATSSAPYLAPVVDYHEGSDPDDGYGEYDEAAYSDDYQEWDEDPRDRRSSGAGALAILGFLALGVLALLGGAVLAGVFSGDPQTGQVDASPTASVSTEPLESSSAVATPQPSESEALSTTSAPRESGDPIEFPDGFTAEVQPCLPGSADVDGCDSNGSNNGGSVVIWVGFTNGTGEDVISAQVVPEGGTPEGTGTMDLARLGCQSSCNGWTYFPFENLTPGTYQVLVTRNGDPAGETSFVVY